MNTNKPEHVLAAKAIRVVLKKAFPKTKFSVTSSSFSMGNSVDISWQDGPAQKDVDALVEKYQYGHFNGMEDIYEYSNSRQDIPQAKYVSVNRRMSEYVRDAKKLELVAKHGIENPDDQNEWQDKTGYWSDAAIWRELADETIWSDA